MPPAARLRGPACPWRRASIRPMRRYRPPPEASPAAVHGHLAANCTALPAAIRAAAADTSHGRIVMACRVVSSSARSVWFVRTPYGWCRTNRPPGSGRFGRFVNRPNRVNQPRRYCLADGRGDDGGRQLLDHEFDLGAEPTCFGLDADSKEVLPEGPQSHPAGPKAVHRGVATAGAIRLGARPFSTFLSSC